MAELVRRAAIVALWARVFLLVLVGELSPMGNDRRPKPPPLTSSQPRGLEWRSIKRVGPRIVAFRLQVVMHEP